MRVILPIAALTLFALTGCQQKAQLAPQRDDIVVASRDSGSSEVIEAIDAGAPVEASARQP